MAGRGHSRAEQGPGPLGPDVLVWDALGQCGWDTCWEGSDQGWRRLAVEREAAQEACMGEGAAVQNRGAGGSGEEPTGADASTLPRTWKGRKDPEDAEPWWPPERV